MKKIAIVGLLALLLGFLVVFLLDRFLVSPRLPKFTLGPDTTVLTAPLHSDGTVNYLPAINDLLSQGVTPENNAAIPLLQAGIAPDAKDLKRPFMSALKVPAPQPGQTLVNFVDFAKKMPNPLDEAALKNIQATITSRPWTPAEFPLADTWLTRNEKVFPLLESGCTRSRFYLPILGETSPPTDFVVPTVVFVLHESRALTARAMRHAGAGKFNDALVDLHRSRRLARLAANGHMAITDLLAVGVEVQTLRAYRGLFLEQNLSASQLARLYDEITSASVLSFDGEVTLRVEYLLTLEDTMAVIRGDAQRYVAAKAGEYSRTQKINLGYLPNTDWTIALRQMNQLFLDDIATNRLSFREQCQKIEADARRAEILKTPRSPLFETGNVGVPAVEAFLKRRPKEPNADYSRRIGRWFLEGSPGGDLKFYKQINLTEVTYNMTLLALQLEQYRLAPGTYPDTLSDLGTDLPKDLYADGPFHYRREQKGYTLWSVSYDGIDNNASGDDIVVKSEKPDK